MKKILFLILGVLAIAIAGGINVANAKEDKLSDKVKVKHIAKADFVEKVYNYEENPQEWKFEGDKPAIVDFYATWCGPCKMIAPILEELAVEYQGKIDIYKIDTDVERELAGAFGIQSVPTLLFIPVNGEPRVIRGAMPKADFKKVIDDFLLAK